MIRSCSEDIVGKSGKLKMKITIENTDVRTITLKMEKNEMFIHHI